MTKKELIDFLFDVPDNREIEVEIRDSVTDTSFTTTLHAVFVPIKGGTVKLIVSPV